MNKQELINWISKNKVLRPGVFGFGISETICTDDLIKKIKQLDEPQKVKVPKSVGELLDYYRNSTDVDLLALLITFKGWYFRKDKVGENENAIDWLVKHPEKYMRAWLDGYEVEEEPKWVVPLLGLETSDKRQQYLSYDQSNKTFFASRKSQILKQTFTADELAKAPGVFANMAVPIKKEVAE